MKLHNQDHIDNIAKNEGRELTKDEIIAALDLLADEALTRLDKPEVPGEDVSDPQQTSKGFAVVGLHASLGFTPVTNPRLSAAFRFQALWIFGNPTTPREQELARAVAPLLVWVPKDKVHRIPSSC